MMPIDSIDVRKGGLPVIQPLNGMKKAIDEGMKKLDAPGGSSN